MTNKEENIHAQGLVFVALKKAIYTESLDYRLVERLQQKLLELIEVRDAAITGGNHELVQDINASIQKLYLILTEILDFQNVLLGEPSDVDKKPHLMRIK